MSSDRVGDRAADRVIRGPVRHGRNLSSGAKGSIHDDATAQEIGFRGGTVAGDIHLDQFAPLLVEAFGQQWFETGSLSLHFKHATTDNEPVIAFVERPTAADDTQVMAWMETPEGIVVCEGSAGIGNPAEPTALHQRDLRPVDPKTLRIMRDVVVGEVFDTVTLRPRATEQAALIANQLITEPLPWYGDSSPWGGPIASPLTTAQLLHWEPIQPLARRLPQCIGMFGAIEVRMHNGPVRLGSSYRVTGSVVAVSDTPKTEVLWYDTQAVDEADTLVATLRMMTRLVKASSPLYTG
jgi:acyl dehydratase